MRGLFDQLDNKAISLWNWITQCVFRGMDRDSSSSKIWFQHIYLIFLYGIIIGVWIVFLNLGKFEWGVQDWIWEWRYSRILQEAITSGEIPLHTDPPLSYDVSRYLGIPDVNLAPQMLLLRFLDQGLNFLINTILMISISYIGCLVIRRYYRLSLFSFTLLAVLFNLNGFITAHIGIGHTLFTGYFFLPFFVLLILKLVEGQGSSTWFVQMGLVLFGIELLGTTQIFAICILFLGVLLLFAKPNRLQLLKAMIAGIMLNICRIAPAFIALPDVDLPSYAGFGTVHDLLKGLVVLIPPSKSLVELPIGLWELNMYIGVLGLVLVAYFGFYRTLRVEFGEHSNSSSRSLLITIFLFIMFSIGYIYMPINSLPLPLLQLVHVPSRFFILPLLFLCTFACIHLQAWFDKNPPKQWHYLLLSILLAIFGHDIFQHTRLWRVESVFGTFEEKSLDLSLRISNQIDPLYTNTLIISSMVTLIAIGYILYLLRKGRKGLKYVETN